MLAGNGELASLGNPGSHALSYKSEIHSSLCYKSGENSDRIRLLQELELINNKLNCKSDILISHVTFTLYLGLTLFP